MALTSTWRSGARGQVCGSGFLRRMWVPMQQELRQKFLHDHEIAALKNALPGEADPNAKPVGESKDKMLSVQKNDENRSLKTNRLFPTPNKPDPMPQNLAFLFTKITPEPGSSLVDVFCQYVVQDTSRESRVGLFFNFHVQNSKTLLSLTFKIFRTRSK